MTISVLLKDLSPMMGDLIRYAIEAAPDMVLVREADNGHGAGAPDAVVLGSEPGCDLAKVTSVLDRWPKSVVVAIEARAKRSSFYELQPQRTVLGEIAPSDLVQLIRDKAARAPPPA